MLQRNARFNLLNAVAASAGFTLINQYISIFATKLGADNLQLGYLSSWPNLVSVIAVLGAAAAVSRSRAKQRLIASIFFLGRAAALGAAAVPWFPERDRVWALIGFWVLAVFPNSAGGTALQSFVADVFPARERSKAFAARNSWTTIAGMVVIPISGYLLDNLFPYPLGYQIMFAASFAVAILEIYYFLRLREPAGEGETTAGKPPETKVDFRTYLSTFSHKPFALFLMVSIPFHFTWQTAWPIFTRYQFTDLAMDNIWLSWTTVANQAGQILTYSLWSRLGERHGNLLMMAVAAVNIASAPALTAWAPSMPWLVVVNFITGVGVAGTVQLILNNQLDVSPAAQRPVFLAVHMALVSISATIAPLVGAFMMSVMDDRTALWVSSVPRVVTAFGFLALHMWVRRGRGVCQVSEPIG